jgi:hypothetical protein
MRKLGVDLIKSTKTPKKSKNGYTCYARISCAFAKHSSDEKMMQQRENRGVGSTENSRKTKTKRTTDCPCALNLIWKSTDPGWYVSSINCAHEGHFRFMFQTDELSEEEKQSIRNLRNDFLGVQAIINLMRREHGLQLSTKQVENVSQQVVDNCGEIIENASNSAKLLQYFNKHADIICIARYNVRRRDNDGEVIAQLCQIKIPGHSQAYDRPDRFSDLCISDLLEIDPL